MPCGFFAIRSPDSDERVIYYAQAPSHDKTRSQRNQRGRDFFDITCEQANYLDSAKVRKASCRRKWLEEISIDKQNVLRRVCVGVLIGLRGTVLYVKS